MSWKKIASYGLPTWEIEVFKHGKRFRAFCTGGTLNRTEQYSLKQAYIVLSSLCATREAWENNVTPSGALLPSEEDMELLEKYTMVVEI